MPLALVGALLILLSALSQQTLALQQQRQITLEQQQWQGVDRLASAAHQWAHDLHGDWRCLLTVPSSVWSLQPCAKSADFDRLYSKVVDGRTVRLMTWQPGVIGQGELSLQLVPDGLQRRFRLGYSGLKERL